MTVDAVALGQQFPQPDALSFAVDSMPYPFVYYVAERDEQGEITGLQLVYANAFAQGMVEFGSVGVTQAIGAVRSDHRALFEAYCEVVENGVSWRGDVLLDEEVLGDELITRAFDVSTVRVGDGVAAIWFDITDRVATQDALRESDSRLNLLIQALPTVVMAQDLDLRFSWILRPGYGFSEEDVIGKTEIDFLPSEEAERTTAIKRQVIVAGKGERYQVSMPIGGEMIVFDTSVEPMRDESGEIIGVLTAATDVTQRLAEDRARVWAVATVQTVNVALMAVDKDWMIRSWNRGAERLFGYQHAEAVGQPVTLLTASSDPCPFTTAIDDILSGQLEIIGETNGLRNKDGSVLVVDFSLKALTSIADADRGVACELRAVR
ncbi:MAG: PAS domain S-box protein [Thermoleophilaceae bacterium]|nr:PAS domain S-box protein [Thermoleophilaceae bacterium]